MKAHDSENPTSINVLLPRAGYQLIDNETEDLLKGFTNEFEPGWKLEVEFEESNETLSDSSVDLSRPSTSKRRKVCSQLKWHKKKIS